MIILKEVKHYICEICGTEYNDKTRAQHCEKGHCKPLEIIKERYLSVGSGTMIQSMITSTVIGSGYVNVNVPYARFTYYGKVMIYEPTGSTYAPKDEKKIVTQTNLKYQEAPTRGAFYFERMKEAKRVQILKGAQEIANKL